jgi:uncharacterized protein (TIGR02996 family)
MRTFEHDKARSRKFFTVDLRGATVTKQFGAAGTKGSTKTRTFPDESAARDAADALVRDLLARGYRETTTSGAPDLRLALEEAILADPEDRAAHAALADLLTERGDPRGEFMQVQMALEDDALSAEQREKLARRERELLAKHQREWVGDWAELAPAADPEGRGQLDFPGPKPFRFIRGVLAEVTIDELTLECAQAFVASPQTGMVRRLFLGGYAFQEPGQYDPGDLNIPDEAVHEPSRVVLPRWKHFSNLRVFQLGWTSDEEYGDFCHFQCHLGGGDVCSLVRNMPRLEELYLFASGVDVPRLFALRTLRNLRVLQVYHSWRYPLEKLAAKAAFSNLTHLLLHPKARGAWTSEADEPYIRFRGVKAVLHSPHLGKLTHLRLRLTDVGDRGCLEVVKSGVLKRLEVLDLRHGCVSDKGARILAGCPDVKNLKLLDLSRNELTEQGIAALQAAGAPLRAEHQHGPTTCLEDRQYLFEGDYE